MFSDELIFAIKATSGHVLADLPDGDCRNSAVIAELTIDADRMAMFGNVKENEELRKLFSKHGYDAVIKEVEKHV